MSQSQDINKQLNELLEKGFAVSTEEYNKRGFKRRVGYGTRPAIVHIDMANAWTREGHAFTCENMETIIPACQALNEAARAKGVPVIYTTTAYDITDRDKPSDMGLWASKIPVELLEEGSDAVKIDDRIAPAPGELVITKKRASAFPGTNLQQFLTANRINTVIVTGVTAAGCVRHTAGHDPGRQPPSPCPAQAAAASQPSHGTTYNLIRAHGAPSLQGAMMQLDKPHNPQPTRTRGVAAPQVSCKTLRKVTIAAAAGTVVEWFDFAVYGFLAPLLARTFFPEGDPVVALLQTFAVFAVAFAPRPVGGAFFGTLGDRIGRKRVLALTVLLMSGATMAIGLLPSYQTIGVWAAVLLTLARSLQGLSAGGEYAGAVTYVIEHSPDSERSRHSSWMPAATFGSFAAAALLRWALTAGLSTEAMNSWGWRIPFLVAAPLGLVAFYIRSKLDESPLFREVLESSGTEHSPLRQTLATQWRKMAVLGGYISLTALSFYTFSTYMTTFLREVVHLPADAVLLSNVLALSFAAVIAPVIGRICDRVGRRPTMFASAVLLGGLAVPSYLLASGGSIYNALAGQVLLALGAVTANVVTAVLLSEVFPTAVRYTASAVTYNVSYAIFGGTAPFVATWLISLTANKMAPAIYLTVVAAGALAAVFLMRETSNRSFREDS
ncbi:MFS transporter [Arthrobacter sp. GCM10027362]|uniref:MFS transporter n=1 Tax=Arthrobacter sp. GCM10027362 TaxID=3273379 RepID=UPI0036452A8E